MDSNEKQKYFSQDFGQYHLDILEDLDRRYSLKDKVVVDVGGSNIPVEIMQLFGVKKFVCVDAVSSWHAMLHLDSPSQYKGKNIYKKTEFQEVFQKEFSFIVDDDIENIGQEMSGLFDIVVSVSTFEHVRSMEKTLSVIYDILAPQGIVYSQYEPIFSCVVGHHVWATEQFNFNTMPEIDHMHLLYTREQAVQFLDTIERFDMEIKKKVLEIAYDSDIINRLTLNDHIRSFQNAPFNQYHVTYFNIQPVPKETLEILYKKHGSMRYDVRGIRYIAFK